MTTTNKVSKRDVMSRAWRIYKQKLSNYSRFSECLVRAWKVEKENLKYRIEKAELEASTAMFGNYEMTNIPWKPSAETMHAYYNSGCYKGD